MLRDTVNHPEEVEPGLEVEMAPLSADEEILDLSTSSLNYCSLAMAP